MRSFSFASRNCFSGPALANENELERAAGLLAQLDDSSRDADGRLWNERLVAVLEAAVGKAALPTLNTRAI